MAKADKDKPASAGEDRYEFVADGTLVVVVDGEAHRMRRPKTGEYRKLRERLWELQDEQVVITQRHRDEAEERAKELKGEPAVTKTLDVRARSRTLTAELEALNEQWMREAFDMLGDSPLPEAIDVWPTWLREWAFIGRIVEHWRSVP